MFKRKIITGCEERGDKDKPYLIRWELLKTKWFQVYFHKFVRSDADEHHDHPWNFYTFILWRGYIEETVKEDLQFRRNSGWFERKLIRTNIKAPSILWRPATHRHRVVLKTKVTADKKVIELPAYSLVITGKYIREWGFFTSNGWQNFKEYFIERKC